MTLMHKSHAGGFLKLGGSPALALERVSQGKHKILFPALHKGAVISSVLAVLQQVKMSNINCAKLATMNTKMLPMRPMGNNRIGINNSFTKKRPPLICVRQNSIAPNSFDLSRLSRLPICLSSHGIQSDSNLSC